MQNKIGYLQSCNYQGKHPTLFSMAPKCEQSLAYASGGLTRNMCKANKHCFVRLHITSNIIIKYCH